MIDILDQLNARPGISGSLLLTPDGITIAARLPRSSDVDRTSAFISSLLVGLNAVGAAAKAGDTTELTVSGTEGRVMVLSAKGAWLVALTERHVELEQGRLELQSTAAALSRRMTITQ